MDRASVIITLITGSSYLVTSLLLPHPRDGEVVRGRGFAAPPSSSKSSPIPSPHSSSSSSHSPSFPAQPERVRLVPGYDQFQDPDSFQPVSKQYSLEDLQPSRDQEKVTGPPLGDNILEFYQKYLENLQTTQEKDIKGLTEIRQKKERSLSRKKPRGKGNKKSETVKLDFSSLLEAGDETFSPNAGWKGEKQTGLLQVPEAAEHFSSGEPLSFLSSAAGSGRSFNPNGRWYGEKTEGLQKTPTAGKKRQTPVALSNPSRLVESVSSNSWTPSRWVKERERSLEAPRGHPSDSEPSVITIENLSSFLQPDTFTVDVNAVLRTRGNSQAHLV